jgi:hypothetical protein
VAGESIEPKKVDDVVRFWLGEVAAARKREKTWRKEGQRIREMYDGKKKDSIPFNILYSNTETLLPAMYNAQPRPVVQRRFKDEDPLGKAASQAGQRVLEFLVDTNSEDYESFDDIMGDAVLDALLPGRGASRIDYDAKIIGESPNRQVKWELVCFNSLKWDRWVHGQAKKWSKVPWVAFEHDVDLDEAKELFTPAVVNKMTFAEAERVDDKEEEERKEDADQTKEVNKVCKVWEIWVKRKKQVLWVSPNYTDGLLKEESDPLELTGFFPMPKPLQMLRKAGSLEPSPPYGQYENQAKELNRISIRINRIVEALKVRGAYDSQFGELDKILKADDAVLVAAENVAALNDKGFEAAIWIFPIEKLVVVLQQLIIARQQCKQVIYEITGISDILRGATVASETATAQELKSQWGTLRIKRMQKEVARYARDCLRIALEIAAKRFSEETFAKMTGLPYSTTPALQNAQSQVAAARSQIAMSGQPVQPQAIQQMVPQAVQTLQAPPWPGVLAMLRDDTQRVFRIDIETNSTVDIEATEDQKIMGEVLQAISQFIQGISPLIVSGTMPFQVAQSMLLAIVRRYRFGAEIEDYIKGMQPPAPPDQAKQQADQAKLQAEQKMAEETHQMDMQARQQELAAKERETKMTLDAKDRELQMEAIYKDREHQMRLKEMDRKEQHAVRLHEVKVAGLEAQVAAAKAMPKKPAGKGGSSASA